jgi:phage-related protein
MQCADVLARFGCTRDFRRSLDTRQRNFELRMKSKEGIGRVFYCILPNQRVIVLHSFVKKTAKTPLKELRIAQTRAKEVASDADA